jgi:hypothetical protein
MLSKRNSNQNQISFGKRVKKFIGHSYLGCWQKLNRKQITLFAKHVQKCFRIFKKQPEFRY